MSLDQYKYNRYHLSCIGAHYHQIVSIKLLWALKFQYFSKVSLLCIWINLILNSLHCWTDHITFPLPLSTPHTRSPYGRQTGSRSPGIPHPLCIWSNIPTSSLRAFTDGSSYNLERAGAGFAVVDADKGYRDKVWLFRPSEQQCCWILCHRQCRSLLHRSFLHTWSSPHPRIPLRR